MTSTGIRLIIAAPEKNADILYMTRFWAPDPLALLDIDGKTILFVSDLELGRARETAHVDVVEASTPMAKRLKEEGVERPGYAEVIHRYLADLGMEQARIEVPGSMEVRYVEMLRQLRHEVVLGGSPFLPQRRRKSDWEITHIAEAMRATEQAIDGARHMIRNADAKDGILFSDGDVLTSERVRQYIEIELLKEGCQGTPPIVSCGDQAAMPHEEGSGPLKSGETIVIDVFPRSKKTFYHADQTRTVVHGTPSDMVRKMHRTVAKAVRMTIEDIRPGVDGKDLHQRIKDLFEGSGFETKTVDGAPQGFFHGTGHGVGLEVHELPRISDDSQLLEEGDVVTVEPGLYYPGVGGVRIEELVVVTADGCRNFATLDWNL